VALKAQSLHSFLKKCCWYLHDRHAVIASEWCFLGVGYGIPQIEDWVGLQARLTHSPTTAFDVARVEHIQTGGRRKKVLSDESAANEKRCFVDFDSLIMDIRLRNQN